MLGRFEARLTAFCEKYALSEKDYPHFFTLVRGVRTQLDEIRHLLTAHSQHWKIDRMSTVDRTLMKIAVFEMLYCDDVPATVAINEAIEISKRFSSEDAGRFINGVLDGVCKQLNL